MDTFIVGDIDGLMSLLAEDVTVWSDGGGKVSAARQPIRGRDKVARAALAIVTHAPEDTAFVLTELNGLAALLIRIKGQVAGVLTLEVEGDLIRAVRTVANPDKLSHLNLPGTSNQEWRVKS